MLDRIHLSSLCIVGCFASVLVLSSQSAASLWSYLLVLILAFSFRQWRDVGLVKLHWVIVALLVFYLASAFWSEPFTWRDVVSILGRCAVIYAFVVSFAECHVRGQVSNWIAIALMFLGALAAALAMVAFVIDPPSLGRLVGFGQLDNPVVAGLTYGAALIMALHAYKESRNNLVRALGLASGALLFVAIFLTDSRNAWISTLLAVMVYLVALRLRDLSTFLITVITVAISFFVILAIVFLSEDLSRLIFPREDSFRIVIWGEVLRRIEDAGYLIGAGVNSDDDFMLKGYGLIEHPHSLYLSVGLQTGIIGLSVFLSVLLMSVQVLLRNYSSSDAKLALALLTMGAVSHLVDGHELVDKVGLTWLLLWFPIAIALGHAWRESIVQPSLVNQ